MWNTHQWPAAPGRPRYRDLMDGAPRPGGQSVRKALLVLEEVAVRQPVTVAALARALNLPKTTVQRSLTTLGDAGYLTQSDGDRSWSLSTKVSGLGERAVSEFTLRQAAADPMRRLRDTTGESVLLVERAKSSVIVLDVVVSNHVIQAITAIGTLLPLHASAGGKVILAASGGTQDPDLRGPLTRFTNNTLTDQNALAAELEQVRQRGWASQRLEFEGDVASVAAAIPQPDRRNATAAVVLFGPATRLTDDVMDRVASLVVQTANEIANRMR